MRTVKAKSKTLSSKFQRALALHQRGLATQAQPIYEEILKSQPLHFDALHLLGVIAAQKQNYGEALELIRKAISIDRNNAVAHNNMGSVLRELQQWDAALASYDQAIALQSNYADAYFNRGLVLTKLTRPGAALAGYDQVIAIQPNNAKAHFNRGVALQELGQLAAALVSYDQAIALQSDSADAYFNRGKVLYELNQLDAALASYDSAISQKPEYAGAYCNRAIVLGALGQREAAIASYDQAIAINPRDPGAFYNRGQALQELNRLDEALDSYSEAIALHPNFIEAYNNRGGVLKELNQFDAALASYDQAIALNESLAEAYCGKGAVLGALGQLDSAINNYEKAIAFRDDFALAHFGRAVALLSAGDFDRGWLAYEWRWRKNRGVGVVTRKEFRTPPWLGNESIAGHAIVLHGEQGLGDTLQFCRYATIVAGLRARVILEVPQSLKTLVASVEGVSEVVVPGETLPAFDHHCPLMSLPLAFKSTLDTVPAPRRYIHSPEGRVQFWKEKLAPSKGKLKVGLVWSGGFRPNQPEAWSMLDRRNVPLAHLAPLRHADIEFFSLQLGQPADGDLARLVAENWDGPPIVDYTSFLADFSDTAGLIDNLDLVIAVDTSTAHLAGALGKPVWILNRFDTCWRWLLHREDSPWYPSAKIYRQVSPGDWSGVIQKVRSDLFRLLG
jgi:tetratricopeptide (TPR) repeat protein